MYFIFKCDSKQKTSDNLASVADTLKRLFFFFFLETHWKKVSRSNIKI